MRIHADFSLPALVLPEQQHWVPSPQAGVERVMLDRIGEEKARATSLVRYAPNSFFPEHEHPEGEEILVLAGVFCEGELRHGAGSYLRNHRARIISLLPMKGLYCLSNYGRCSPLKLQPSQ